MQNQVPRGRSKDRQETDLRPLGLKWTCNLYGVFHLEKGEIGGLHMDGQHRKSESDGQTVQGGCDEMNLRNSRIWIVCFVVAAFVT